MSKRSEMEWIEGYAGPLELKDGYYWMRHWEQGKTLIELVKVKDNKVFTFTFPDDEGTDVGEYAGDFMGPIPFPDSYSLEKNTNQNCW